ncbi:g-protein coupled receptor 98 [Trichonephila inaurata madagascariensis]|uniref:G-protein coupled receptor 98 n=1 Tax=Trichonephila inaurata madagascariensis TaxID=2747483 RepID=A0A8X6MCZ0_9ARAC|nr:g-protein coupled receptor 98 [Trichonephila inaurata madagascariensis]
MEIGVVRKEGSDGRIRAKYDTKPKTAQALADFSPVSGDVIFEPGETRKTIRTSGVLEFEKPFYTVVESVGIFQIGVVRKEGSDGQVRVGYQTVNKTAKSGEDFSPVFGHLTFEPGQTRKTIPITIKNDDVKENLESFEVQLFDPTALSEVFNFRGLGKIHSVPVTIEDDDMTPGTLELEEPIIIVSEGVRQMLVWVNRVGGTDGQIRCRYRTIPKTAVPGVDYEPNFGELIFQPGETRHVIKFRIINDLIREPLKNFQIELFDAQAGPGVLNFRGLGTKKTSLVTIADDDQEATKDADEDNEDIQFD